MAQPHKDYSGTPLYRKLGIREGSRVRAVDAPEHFIDLLGPLPSGVEIVDADEEPLDVIVLFETNPQDLQASFDQLSHSLAPAGGLWVAWPKKSSKIPNDLTFEQVQQIGLYAGLVDNKSCAIDADWQGLRFVFRLKDRPAPK